MTSEVCSYLKVESFCDSLLEDTSCICQGEFGMPGGGDHGLAALTRVLLFHSHQTGVENAILRSHCFLSFPQTPNLKLLKVYERNWGKRGLQIVLLSWLWILFLATTESLRKKLIKGRLHGLLFQVKNKKTCDMYILWGRGPICVRFWS